MARQSSAHAEAAAQANDEARQETGTGRGQGAKVRGHISMPYTQTTANLSCPYP
jgi:hypothetical protein